MNYTTAPEKLPTISADVAAEQLNKYIKSQPDENNYFNNLMEEDLEYFSWPQTFGSTTGPFGGIGGAAMSTFTMEAWVFMRTWAYVFCRGRFVRYTNKFTFQVQWR